MKVLVYDVAAESGGALSMLMAVYDYAVQHKEIEWKFIVSKVDLESMVNIQVEKYPQVKKNWLARLKFDKFTAPKIVKKFVPDIVFNMQNVAIKCNAKQVLYMHQSLPFAEYKFSIKNKKMWVYQNIIGRMIKSSCKKVDEIVVQTNWIKNAIIRECRVCEDKITVKQPFIDALAISKYCGQVENNWYFYPASGSPYKNHKLIVEACLILKNEGYEDYKIVFTLDGNESPEIKEMYELSKRQKLNIDWIGYIDKTKVNSMYAEYGLIFPSYIETFGLPLLEARTAGAPILASDTLFSKEICNDYGCVRFFDYTDAKLLAELIKSFNYVK